VLKTRNVIGCAWSVAVNHDIAIIMAVIMAVIMATKAPDRLGFIDPRVF
jgi:hypothetical protein